MSANQHATVIRVGDREYHHSQIHKCMQALSDMTDMHITLDVWLGNWQVTGIDESGLKMYALSAGTPWFALVRFAYVLSDMDEVEVIKR